MSYDNRMFTIITAIGSQNPSLANFEVGQSIYFDLTAKEVRAHLIDYYELLTRPDDLDDLDHWLDKIAASRGDFFRLRGHRKSTIVLLMTEWEPVKS